MATYKLYSLRQKELRGEVVDIYTYDQLPEPLRIQIIHIYTDAIGVDNSGYYKPRRIYEGIRNKLCREYGQFSLLPNYRNSEQELKDFFMTTRDFDKAMDVVELTFKTIDYTIRRQANYTNGTDVKLNSDQAIEELNERFKQHGVGYSYENGGLIRIDSTYTHAEIVKPTLALMQSGKFAGPNEEYLKAHEHYRHGRNKECLAECLKAFESTMKVICTEKGWEFDSAKDTASKLIAICFANNLIPAYMQNHVSALKNVLDSGINTLRNKTSGHGQGQVPTTVDDQVARYGLNLTGSNIIFLIEQSGL